MAWQRAFPYAVDDSAIRCEASILNKSVVERADGTWDAYSNQVEDVSFEVAIRVDRERVAACIPDGFAVEDVVELVVSIEGIQARKRLELYRLDLADCDATVKLDPLEYVGRVDVAVTARLTKALDPHPGFAHLKSSRLARADLPSIWFTEPPQFAGDALEIRWEDFDADGDLVDGDLFTIRMEERPVILLNSAIPSAYDILNSKGTWGAAARIRDAIYAQIVHQAWSSILSHCLLEIARHDDDDSAETVLAELEDWQAQVIRAWAPEFIPNETDQEAAALALIEQARENGSLILLHRLPEVIQGKCQTISGFNGLIKEFDRFQGGSR